MTNDSCHKIVQHLSRIQGQMNTLKAYMEQEHSCDDIAHLTRSILTSFSSVRTSIIEETITREFGSKRITPKESERLRTILQLFKS